MVVSLLTVMISIRYVGEPFIFHNFAIFTMVEHFSSFLNALLGLIIILWLVGVR